MYIHSLLKLMKSLFSNLFTYSLSKESSPINFHFPQESSNHTMMCAWMYHLRTTTNKCEIRSNSSLKSEARVYRNADILLREEDSLPPLYAIHARQLPVPLPRSDVKFYFSD